MTALIRSLFLFLALAPLPLRAGTSVFGELSADRAPVSPPVPVAVAAEDRSAPKPHYLSLDGLDLRAVPAPPAAGSYEDSEDIRAVLEWQDRRTGAQCAAARAEMSHDYDTFFSKISPFGSPTPAQVKKFFGDVAKDSVAAHTFLKDAYQRPRPADRDSRVRPCIPNARGLSYPSGHSAMSRLFALILADLVPARRAEFMAKADESALLRVIGGAHHPTDTAAGKLLADTLYKALKQEPSFLADLKALKPLLR